MELAAFARAFYRYSEWPATLSPARVETRREIARAETVQRVLRERLFHARVNGILAC